MQNINPFLSLQTAKKESRSALLFALISADGDSNLYKLIFPAAKSDLLTMDQGGLPIGIWVRGLEIIRAAASLPAADDGGRDSGLAITASIQA